MRLLQKDRKFRLAVPYAGSFSMHHVQLHRCADALRLAVPYAGSFSMHPPLMILVIPSDIGFWPIERECCASGCVRFLSLYILTWGLRSVVRNLIVAGNNG